jgi:signal transduction histidine kinase
LGLIAALLLSAGVMLALALAASHDAVRSEHESAAQRMAKLFEASLQNAMLKRDLAGLNNIIAALGDVPGVARARLVEPQGMVRFASQSAVVGTSAHDSLSGLCLTTGCAVPKPKLEWHASDDGEQLQIAYPVLNQTRCMGCHGAPAQHPVNGVLLLDFKPVPAAHLGQRSTWMLVGAGLVALMLFAALMSLTLRRRVAHPLAQLTATADRLASGDLDARVNSGAEDELGRVSRSFDRMAGRLEHMVGKLQEERRFLQSLVDALPDPVLVIGSDFRIRLANQAYARLLGHDLGSVVGRCCHQVSKGSNEPCPSTLLNCPVAEIRKRSQPIRSLMTLQKLDGGAVEVDIEAAPFVASNGERLTVEVMRPLDRSIQFSQQQRLSTIGLLANGVAHEIHNPLASIRLALQACLRGLRREEMPSDELIDYLQLVDSEIDRCVLTTQRLLQMSQSPSPVLQPVGVATAIGDVMALLSEEFRERQVTVQMDGMMEDEHVLGDEAELRQVLVNLIHNALHAMPNGGKIHIQTTPTDDGLSLKLSVSDTGSGIAPDDLPLIFMPFFSHRIDGQRGTGLGLAICKATMERFGGQIDVVSRQNAGSTFTLTLQRVPSSQITSQKMDSGKGYMPDA